MPKYIVEKDKYVFTEKDKMNKSNEFAPDAYTWIGNTITADKNLIDYYKNQNCVLLNTAYDIYNNLLSDHVAIYKRI